MYVNIVLYLMYCKEVKIVSYGDLKFCILDWHLLLLIVYKVCIWI